MYCKEHEYRVPLALLADVGNSLNSIQLFPTRSSPLQLPDPTAPSSRISARAAHAEIKSFQPDKATSTTILVQVVRPASILSADHNSL
eukprot:765219-Hanusia_phi.AAC.1